MKFLCDQCKAKYQISDDKVAGKTVRMKCRKCGHMIEVRAAVTETSVASNVPSEAPPAPAAPGAPPRPPAPPAKPSAIPKSPLATSLSQAKPSAPRQTRPPAALNDAFKANIQKDDEAALLELASADEWYAAINGVPVGPIRIGELRRKAALGAVTEDSLVWQEGMEEWRPVKTLPDLAAMVREAAASKGMSMATPEPMPVKSIPPAPLVPNVNRPAAPRAPQPPRPAPPARSNVVPITSRLATAEKLDESPLPEKDKAKEKSGSGAPPPNSERLSVAPDPFAMPAASGGIGLTPAPGGAVAASATPLGPPGPSLQQPIIIQQPKQTNYIGIGVILAMTVFGGVAAWALFFKKEPPPQQVVAPPAQTVYIHDQAPAAPVPTDTAPAPTAKVASRGGGSKVAAAAPTQSAQKLDLGSLGLGGSPGLVAPSGPGLTGGGPSANGGALSESQIESVVRGHQIGIRRTCWERGSSGVNNAQITVHVNVDGGGHVTGAIATGNDPVTGKCLENEIQRWNFGGGPGEFNIPFKFVRQ